MEMWMGTEKTSLILAINLIGVMDNGHIDK